MNKLSIQMASSGVINGLIIIVKIAEALNWRIYEWIGKDIASNRKRELRKIRKQLANDIKVLNKVLKVYEKTDELNVRAIKKFSKNINKYSETVRNLKLPEYSGIVSNLRGLRMKANELVEGAKATKSSLRRSKKVRKKRELKKEEKTYKEVKTEIEKERKDIFEIEQDVEKILEYFNIIVKNLVYIRNSYYKAYKSYHLDEVREYMKFNRGRRKRKLRLNLTPNNTNFVRRWIASLLRQIKELNIEKLKRELGEQEKLESLVRRRFKEKTGFEIYNNKSINQKEIFKRETIDSEKIGEMTKEIINIQEDFVNKTSEVISRAIRQYNYLKNRVKYRKAADFVKNVGGGVPFKRIKQIEKSEELSKKYLRKEKKLLENYKLIERRIRILRGKSFSKRFPNAGDFREALGLRREN